MIKRGEHLRVSDEKKKYEKKNSVCDYLEYKVKNAPRRFDRESSHTQKA